MQQTLGAIAAMSNYRLGRGGQLVAADGERLATFLAVGLVDQIDHRTARIRVSVYTQLPCSTEPVKRISLPR